MYSNHKEVTSYYDLGKKQGRVLYLLTGAAIGVVIATAIILIVVEL
jgi:hypothetical protein